MSSRAPLQLGDLDAAASSNPNRNLNPNPNPNPNPIQVRLSGHGRRDLLRAERRGL